MTRSPPPCPQVVASSLVLRSGESRRKVALQIENTRGKEARHRFQGAPGGGGGLPGGPLPLPIGWRLSLPDPEPIGFWFPRPFLLPPPTGGRQRLRAGFLGNHQVEGAHLARSRAREGVAPAAFRLGL